MEQYGWNRTIRSQIGLLAFPLTYAVVLISEYTSFELSSEQVARGKGLALGFEIFFALFALVTFGIILLPFVRRLESFSQNRIAAFAAGAAAGSLLCARALPLTMAARALHRFGLSDTGLLYAAPLLSVCIATGASYWLVFRTARMSGLISRFN